MASSMLFKELIGAKELNLYEICFLFVIPLDDNTLEITGPKSARSGCRLNSLSVILFCMRLLFFILPMK